MLNLPVELQEEILDYLSREDLISLAQSCKSLSPVARARLRAIIPKLDPSAFTRCIRVLMADSVRAAEILELNIAKYEFKTEPLAPPQPSSQRSGLFATLKNTIRGSGPPSVILTEQRPCDPPHGPPLGPLDFSGAFKNLIRLRKLVIHAPQNPLLWMSPVVVVTLREIYAHSGAESTPMLGWISYQPRINTLRIHCNENKLREYRVDPPTSLFFPSLSFLTTNPEGLSVILPESVVEDLHIEGLIYGQGLLEKLKDVAQPQRPSLIRAIRDSHERTKLRRLTLIGDGSIIFMCLKVLAEEGVFVSHIRIVLRQKFFSSIAILVSQNVLRVLLDSYLLLFVKEWNPYVEDAIQLLSTLEILEIFNGVLDQPHIVTRYDTHGHSYSMERDKSLMWGRKCPRLHTIRFPSSRWRIKREDGKLSVNRETH